MGFTEPSIANITIDFGTTGIDNPTNKNTVFNLYPNPTNGLFKIKNPLEEKITVEVKNVQGEVVYKETSKTSILPIDLKQNAKGIYFVTITSNDENNTFKLVVQ